MMETVKHLVQSYVDNNQDCILRELKHFKIDEQLKRTKEQ